MCVKTVNVMLIVLPQRWQAPVKFLHLFGKSTTTPLRDIRQTPAAVPSAAEETTRKIDAIESEISAELSDGGTDTAEPAGLLTQRIDEASLLYASRQPAAAEALLSDTANNIPDRLKFAGSDF